MQLTTLTSVAVEAMLANIPSSLYRALEAPVAFEGVFGWFRSGATRRGVVLCGTLGFEQLSAYRAWRELAAQIADAGCATLRFDFPGDGNSADVEVMRADILVGAIARAVGYLRTEACVDEIVVVGLRLGATLAALSASSCGIDRLVLLAPFTSGHAYLREMRLRSRTVDRLSTDEPIPQPPGDVLLGGFRLGPALVADLSAVDLMATTQAPAPNVLIVGPDTAQLSRHYEELGSRVTSAPFAGLAQLLIGDLFSETPKDTFEAVVTYACADAKPASSVPPAVRAAGAIGGAGWTEVPARFGMGLVGTLCRPDRPVANAPTILFLGSGRNARSGRGRQIAILARRLARSGFRSLRFDLRGIGDSPDRPDGSSPLYALDTVEDVRAALNYLDGLSSAPILVVGLCSGAFLGFHAIHGDHRIKSAILFNLYCFDWNPLYDVETKIRNPYWGVSGYANEAKKAASWFALLRDPRRIAAITAKLVRLAGRSLKKFASVPFKAVYAENTVAGRIGNIRLRGAGLTLVFSPNEPGLTEVHAKLGRTPSEVERKLGRPLVMIEQADHNLTVDGTLDKFYEIILESIKCVCEKAAKSNEDEIKSLRYSLGF
ncbi:MULTISPECIES: alpha/beta fold hydrolase [unclassified Methylobacterium]|uniref:alpha/beta fold hydrolase n=1 Tax=unclassified Methylobacterium TaxID=2615210 RepID=UPI002269CDCA|nr:MULTISPECIES: alpha/beta fold hydrolase [unclassified Methylobacterium]